MEEAQFQEYLDSLLSRLKGKGAEFIEKELKSLLSLLSFNRYEQMLSFLKDEEILDPPHYELLRKNYLVFNKYLMLYGIGSRIFGEIWAINQLKSLDKRFIEPAKINDPLYYGEYDLIFEGLKIGAKACRAVDLQEEGSRFAKALHYDSGRPFEMNFRQLRIESCDVMVLIGVWIDQLAYWVLSYNEIKNNKYLLTDKGKAKESLLVISEKNIPDFEEFRVAEPQVMDAILEKRRQ
jgi:hypothetical protein